MRAPAIERRAGEDSEFHPLWDRLTARPEFANCDSVQWPQVLQPGREHDRDRFQNSKKRQSAGLRIPRLPRCSIKTLNASQRSYSSPPRFCDLVACCSLALSEQAWPKSYSFQLPRTKRKSRWWKTNNFQKSTLSVKTNTRSQVPSTKGASPESFPECSRHLSTSDLSATPSCTSPTSSKSRKIRKSLSRS